MSHVYVLTSSTDPEWFYVGMTSAFPARLRAHKAGRCTSTKTQSKNIQLLRTIKTDTAGDALRLERFIKYLDLAVISSMDSEDAYRESKQILELTAFEKRATLKPR